MKIKFLSTVFLYCVFLLGQQAIAQNPVPPAGNEEASIKYGYYYKGTFITLNQSKHLVAIEETAVSFKAFVEKSGLMRDPLSDREPLKKRNLGLYRLTTPKSKAAIQIDLKAQMKSFAGTTNKVIQPVFEQGQALLIPSDEVIVGFKKDTSLDQAQEYLQPYLNEQGIIEVREHRKNTYILKIDKPSDGRAYPVCQFLVTLDEVRFAEPNHIVVMLHGPDYLNKLNQVDTISKEDMIVSVRGEPTSPKQTFSSDASALTVPTWQTIASLDFESSKFPPSGWITAPAVGATKASWGRTKYQSHNGSYSIYCAREGSAGVSPPGPAPKNMVAILRSPTVDLTSYEEVYIEVWFYAKNDLNPDPGGTHYDYASVWVCNGDTNLCRVKTLGTPATGDCTTDPTADNGWRKLLFRVPPDYRVANAFFDFLYESNGADQFEGAYLDDIRIVGTKDVDTEPLGNDTYGARHYELKNVGQIAGLGNDNNDLHVPEAWDLVSVSPNVKVAVIDDGVDLTHPDLNVVEGYDYDGSKGGGPRGSHGTACAGKVGAIRNNGIGVIGTAPNVEIMAVYDGGLVANMASAIDVAVQNGADVLSNSWSTPPQQDIENAIKDALAAGVVVVFAAGNCPRPPLWNCETTFPCNLTDSLDVICVGASSPTDEHKGAASSDGEHMWVSRYVGDGPDVCAPGTWIYTTDRQGSLGYNDGSKIDPKDPSSADYDPTFGGTSSSTPQVAGIVALMLSKYPDLTPAQVKILLRNSADDIDAPGWDDKTGAGRLNAYKAVQPPSETVQFRFPTYMTKERGGMATISVARFSSSGTITVDYATSNGTASAGRDYEATSGTLEFAEGVTTQEFTIPIFEDNDPEADETVILTLSNPGGGASLGVPSSAVLTIIESQAYYVNDASLENDEWCTEPGDDGNDGLTPATPKATIQAILSTYDLEEGHVVRIDTGTYNLTSTIVVTAADEGSSTAPVIFEASPWGVTIDRGSTSGYGWYLNNCDYVTIRTATSTRYADKAQSWMKITGASRGIYLSSANYCTINRLEVYGNSDDGIYAWVSDYIKYSNNLVHSNADDGIYLLVCDYSTLENNTISGNADDQLYLQSGSHNTLLNNIIHAKGSGDYGIYRTSGSIDASDYNLIYATDGANIGYYNRACTTLLEWQSQTGKDTHSLSTDPGFVDPDNGDRHLMSTGGSYHGGAWTADASSSACIDAGDPADDYGNEPEENGARLNLGAYGGTEQASKSPAGRELVLRGPIGGYVLEGTFTISWLSPGQMWVGDETLKIEYFDCSLEEWITIAAAVPVLDGSFEWDTTTVPDLPCYRIRITCNEDTSVSAVSGGWFMVRNGPIAYYVNDASLENDEWCSEPGDDGNDGLTPATPKATIQAILSTYDLEEGHVVRIDTGTYNLTSNIEVTAADEGSSTAPVIFEASPWGVTIDRGSTSGYGWYLNNCDYVTIRTATSTKYTDVAQSWMKVTGASRGIYLYWANYCTINRLEVYGNIDGISALLSDYIKYLNNLVHSNTDDGIYLTSSDYNTLENNTISRNTNDQIFLVACYHYTLLNNIIHVKGSGDYGIHRISGTIDASDYNLIYATDGANIGYYNTACATLFEWQSQTGKDKNSLSTDPGFVDPDNGDRHLLSTGGSYHGGAWTADTSSSAAIDAGDPAADYDNEPKANGARLNLGAYGGTEQASKSPAGRELVLLGPIGGHVLEGTFTISWLSPGQMWRRGETLKIEYFDCNLEEWITIAAAVPVKDGFFEWDTSALPNLPCYRIRITWNEDTSVSAVSDGWFTVRNGPIDYYVNDASLESDEWCTELGDDGNNGLTPATPKATIQAILSTYDLEEGDVVRIDTGTYNLTSNIEVTAADEGSSTAPVIFEASPWGVTIDRGSTSGYGWYLNNCDYVTIRTATSTRYADKAQSWMKITGASRGIYLSSANYCTINRLEVYGNSDDGIYASVSKYVKYSNNLVHSNADDGIYLLVCDYSTLENNTISGNADDQIYLQGGSYTLLNNIIHADGSGDYGIYWWYGSISASDYNLIYATDGANIGYYNRSCATLLDWQSQTGKDKNSLSTDPGFVDPAGFNYHLGQDSTGIDAGDPIEVLTADYIAGAVVLDVDSVTAVFKGDTIWITDGTNVESDEVLSVTDTTITVVSGFINSYLVSDGSYVYTESSDFSNEPMPNGGHINMGAYGGTPEATVTYIDSDNDGLPDNLEDTGCTDPSDADTDNDGIIDGDEDTDQDGYLDTGETDPCDADTDDDGIQDGTELGYTLDDIGPDTDPGVFQPDTDPSTTTHPLDLDTDGDGILDGTESGYTLDDIGPDTATGVFQPDTDPSTLTDPLDRDSDGDGILDGDEDINHNGALDAGETDPNQADVVGSILLVDDDEGDEYETYFVNALDANGYNYSVWDVSHVGPSPTAEYLSKYEVVIWNTGYIYHSSTSGLTQNEQEEISKYLDQGGNIFISGQDILYNGVTSDFQTNYLHVADYSQDTGSDVSEGIVGDPISDGMNLALTYPVFDYSDEIIPDQEAAGIFLRDGIEGSFNALRYPSSGSGAFRLVFFAFPFEAISQEDTQPNNSIVLMERIINWLSGVTTTETIY